MLMSIIDIVVSDVEASIAFYRRLGVQFDVDPKYPEHAGADLPNGIHLMLNSEGFTRTYLPDWEKPTGNARTSLCFAFETPEGVDAAYDDITGAGYGSAAKPFDAFWGMRYAVVLDPDGNGVHLYCPTS